MMGNGRSGYDHTTVNSITMVTTASQTVNAADNCQIIHHTNNKNRNENGNENGADLTTAKLEKDEFV